jgi:uncharacterized protein
MNQELMKYLHANILPLYEKLDEAHQPEHVLSVIENALDIAKDYDVNVDMVYTIAIYHDIGMFEGREYHHITGARRLFNDTHLDSFFDLNQKQVMREAIEDHRASSKQPPRSIYGMIIAEADRDIEVEVVIKRTIQYGLSNYPQLSQEEHYHRLYQHLLNKYSENGYLRLWLDTKRNRSELSKLRALIIDQKQLKTVFDEQFKILRKL